MITYRDLPSVDRLVQRVQELFPTLPFPRILLVQAARDELAALRNTLNAADRAQSSEQPENDQTTLTDQLAARVQLRLNRLLSPSLCPVINATGVIIQTNLGRAPLSQAALTAMHAVGAGYSNLEYDLEQGQRGQRTVHLRQLLCHLTGAEAALAVNNNAAAIYLTLGTLAAGREVIVSRGQAVEIGGGFRIPDVLRQSGATLVEVGTTNRTYARDYAAAISERTALLLRVHTSNFRLIGFVHETSLADLAALGRQYNIPVLDDLGSGTLLPTTPYGLAAEPTVQESVSAGADLVTFSGDKLLGGPQAGLIVGRADLVEQIRRYPLARALRVDKTTIAGLEATLLAYVRGQALHEIPIWRMIAMPITELHMRAEALAERLHPIVKVSVISCESAVGGGSLPGERLPSVAIALERHADTGWTLDSLSQHLRTGTPAVVARIADDQLVFDLRTVLPEQDDVLYECIQHVVASNVKIEK